MKRRIDALKQLQVKCAHIEAKFYEEVHDLERKYAALYQPLFDKVRWNYSYITVWTNSGGKIPFLSLSVTIIIRKVKTRQYFIFFQFSMQFCLYCKNLHGVV